MTEAQVTKNGRRVTAMLAGSALTVGTIAMGAPAAFADNDEQQGDVATQDQQSGTEVNHTFELETKEAKPGETVGITGEGFTPNAEVMIDLGNEMMVTQHADEQGNLDGEFTIPDSVDDDTYKLAVEENGHIAYSQLEVLEDDRDDGEVEVDLESDTLLHGDSVQVSGENFTPRGEVTVNWNREQNIAADEDGNILTEISIPEDAEVGEHDLTVADQETGQEDVEEYTVSDSIESDDGEDRDDD
ncbi:hypothetical protein GCM10009720_23520 [Yaniella flava]|uniref:Uncharacterized protein n=1 Tax=Yaniella flava TaxID=287930 RepID=A0ABN2USV0_9MICC